SGELVVVLSLFRLVPRFDNSEEGVTAKARRHEEKQGTIMWSLVTAGYRGYWEPCRYRKSSSEFIRLPSCLRVEKEVGECIVEKCSWSRMTFATRAPVACVAGGTVC